jgi:competence protein ComEA
LSFNLFGRQVSMKKGIVLSVTIFVMILAGISGYMIVKGDSDVIIETQGSTESASVNVAQASSVQSVTAAEVKKENEEIEIYVVGCVNKQGIVKLTKGQLIDDAIRLAGGVTKDADISNINLVYELKENLMLYIKSRKEMQQPVKTDTGSGEAGKGITIVRDSGGAVVNDNGQEDGLKQKVNINTATISELDTLPGVGEATAKEIIAYRDKNGIFKSIQDIMKVPRIKESRFSSIKDLITVD